MTATLGNARALISARERLTWLPMGLILVLAACSQSETERSIESLELGANVEVVEKSDGTLDSVVWHLDITDRPQDRPQSTREASS